MLKLVLDTNRIIAALINTNSTIREILLSEQILFYLPEHALAEIEEHKATILKKSGLTETEFYFTLYYLLRRVTVISQTALAPYRTAAKTRMAGIDQEDTEFAAVALTLENDGIFSDDAHFSKAGFKRWSVEDVLAELKKYPPG